MASPEAMPWLVRFLLQPKPSGVTAMHPRLRFRKEGDRRAERFAAQDARPQLKWPSFSVKVNFLC
jgi:hypothetical protein